MSLCLCRLFLNHRGSLLHIGTQRHHIKKMKTSFKSILPAIILSIIVFTLLSAKKATYETHAITWKVQDTISIGGFKPTVLGNPVKTTDPKGSYLSFNGVNDGLIIQKIPIENWTQFTIEVLFKPSSDGPVAPRFIHFEDKELNRGTFEGRITPQGQWYMDTFLKNGKTNKGLTLIDSTKLHDCNSWYWVAMVYDGKKMSSYINGKKELEGDTNFPAMTSGNTSIGVRLNKVNWFKGAIKEIRFNDRALKISEMQTL
jgi:hypothetical protein